LPGVTYNISKVASKVAREGFEEINPKEIKDTKMMMAFLFVAVTTRLIRL